MTTRRHLVVTADDFGLSSEVNEAVERAHREGVLSAASLMVGAPAAAEAVTIARRCPTLKVGLHLVLIEARPVLPLDRVPGLVDASGAFRNDAAAYGAAIFFSHARRRQVAAEVEAQFAAFARTGLALDHVNAHQHFHLHPVVGATMLAAGRRFSLRAVRLPREPVGVTRALDPEAPLLLPTITRPWTALLGLRLRRAGLAIPDQVFGLVWTGAMTERRVAGLVDHLPGGLTEIYMHPATRGGFPGAAPGYRYAEELAALLSPAVREAVLRSGASLGGFADALLA